MLKLYDLPISSYGCKTRILLRHKKLHWQSIAPPDGYGSDAYCKIVPAGTIPALDDNGFIICDSEAIAEYINEVVPEPQMLPGGPQERAQARALSRFHDTRIEPVLRAYFAQVAPANRNNAFISENAALLQKRLSQLAQMATPSPLLFGEDLCLADCGFAPSFAILNKLQAILGFHIDVPAPLRAYERALSEHPSVCDELHGYYGALNVWADAKLNS
jgi:glutathione S-transferase